MQPATTIDPKSVTNPGILRPFYPALDGLRGIAFLLVFCWHYCRVVSPAAIWKWGWVGVDLFFVISGFLISGILFDSLHNPGYFRGFYIRRTLRIFPLFYGFWLVMLLLTPVFHFHWNRYLALMALYLGNLFIPGAYLHLHADPGIILTGPFSPRVATHLPQFILINHFWSLCVEEQFYLAWPLVIWLVRSRRTLLWLCLALFALVPFGRWAYLHVHPEMLAAGGVYFTTWARPDGLLLGSGLAFYLRGRPAADATLRLWARVTAIAAPMLLAAAYLHEKTHGVVPIFDFAVSTVGFTLLALCACGILTRALDPSPALSRFLQVRPLVMVGRVSYGMYFYHEILYSFVAPHADRLFRYHLGYLMPIAAFGITFAVSWLSYRYFESPFLNLKHILAPRPGAVEDPPAYLAART